MNSSSETNIGEAYPYLILGRSKQLDDFGRRSEATFTTRDFMKGEIIRRLTGEIRSSKEILGLIKDGVIENDDPFPISFEESIILDKASLKINHSCNPNSGIRGESELIAIRHIKAGEEITYDYSTTVNPSISREEWTMQCFCGSTNCRSKIQNITTIPITQLELYLEAGAIPEYLKDIVIAMIESRK